MSIAENVERLKGEIGDAHLIAVSKGRSLDQIFEAYEAGVRDFGENRVDEALEKMEKAPKDIRWHFIGKLQRKKVPKVAGKFTLIHSIDSVELAQKLGDMSATSRILLEVNTSGEESKSGLTPEAWKTSFPQIASLRGVKVEGLMTMAPLTDDSGRIRACFARLRELGEVLELPFLSMGMSQDYKIALEEGATHLRIGTAVFA